MVTVAYDSLFMKQVAKIRDGTLKVRLEKQMRKIVQDPETGKPMRYDRKDTREVYVEPYRLSYLYLAAEDKILFLEFYHKNEQ